MGNCCKAQKEKQKSGGLTKGKSNLSKDDLDAKKESARAARRFADDEFKEAFNHYDDDHDGKISSLELNLCLIKFGVKLSNTELLSFFKSADKDQDARITFDEYINIMHNCPGIEELRAAFECFDVDRDGNITYDEFRAVILELGRILTDKEIKTMFEAADADKNGQINLEEFSLVIRGHPVALNMKELFDRLDKNKNGYIDKDELAEFCKEIQLNVSDAELDEMFEAADRDSDGKICFDEFCGIMWDAEKNQINRLDDGLNHK